MTFSILSERIEGDYKIVEYTKDGVTVAYIRKVLISNEPPELEPVTSAPTLEDKINYLFYKAKGLVE